MCRIIKIIIIKETKRRALVVSLYFGSLLFLFLFLFLPFITAGSTLLAEREEENMLSMVEDKSDVPLCCCCCCCCQASRQELWRRRRIVVVVVQWSASAASAVVAWREVVISICRNKSRIKKISEQTNERCYSQFWMPCNSSGNNSGDKKKKTEANERIRNSKARDVQSIK